MARDSIDCIIQVASLASATFACTLGREQQYFLNANATLWYISSQPRGNGGKGASWIFPSRQQKEGSSSFNSTAWQCGHSCVPPRRKGWGCGILCTGRVCQPRSAIRLARASLMASALARRRVSPSSRDSLARASLMALALARHRVSLSSGDSLARARSERAVLDRKS